MLKLLVHPTKAYLERSNWVKSQAARLLRLNRTTRLEKMKKLNIPAVAIDFHQPA
jgi:transcriptional regulator with GAF, ATPase, and Fis domain